MATINKNHRRLPWEGEKPKPKAWTTLEHKSFYDSRQWKVLREICLANDPFCVHCLSRGVHSISTVADHKIAINDGGSMTDLSNLQGLCASCHNSKSSNEAKLRLQNKNKGNS